MLSIFTLWIYQKSANDTVPELGAQTKPIVEEVAVVQEKQKTVADAPSPFIAQVEVAESQVQEPEVVVEPTPALPEPEVADIELEPVPATPAVPVQVAEDVVPTVEIPATPEPAEEPIAEPVVVPVEPESPFLTDEMVVATPPKPIVDVIVDKPAYNVSQNEKMFVAAPEYETDVAVEEEIETCADGAAPDADGCCAGEELSDMGDGTLMCCAIGTDECFPPML